jgi:uncharacterized membrane protein
MAVGYVLGALLGTKDWRKTVFSIGAALTICFLFLRGFHLYGNSHHHLSGVGAGRWRVEPTLTLTIISFFDTLKYPPSLQFLLMTLGPSLMALAWLGQVNPRQWLARIVSVFGRVPLFYYVIHIYLIRALAVYTALACKQDVAWLRHGGFMVSLPPDGYGHGLPFIYAMWFAVVLLTYPACKWFMRLKQQHADWWWLRYL